MPTITTFRNPIMMESYYLVIISEWTRFHRLICSTMQIHCKNHLNTSQCIPIAIMCHRAFRYEGTKILWARNVQKHMVTYCGTRKVNRKNWDLSEMTFKSRSEVIEQMKKAEATLRTYETARREEKQIKLLQVHLHSLMRLRRLEFNCSRNVSDGELGTQTR